MKRREFFKSSVGTLAGLTILGKPLIAHAVSTSPPRKTPVNRFDTPTFAAFIDTIIPGKETDPTGAPGALEAGTLEYLDRADKAKIFPISIDLLHFLVTRALDFLSGITHFCSFDRLNPRDREYVVQQMLFIPGTAFLLRLIRAPFYTAAVNTVGFDYLGYPGPNGGYDDFSFNEAIGWSEPGAVDGNMP